eukprot:346219-Hanusia_phi.AAC.1
MDFTCFWQLDQNAMPPTTVNGGSTNPNSSNAGKGQHEVQTEINEDILLIIAWLKVRGVEEDLLSNLIAPWLNSIPSAIVLKRRSVCICASFV